MWYYLYNLKNAKNTHGGVSVEDFNFTKSNFHSWVFFFFFLSCTNYTASRKVSDIFVELKFSGCLFNYSPLFGNIVCFVFMDIYRWL